MIGWSFEKNDTYQEGRGGYKREGRYIHIFFRTILLSNFGVKTAYKKANTVYLEIKSVLSICSSCKYSNF